MQFTLVTTEDGSVSCLDAETGELCHNRAGAYTEALKNYIEPSGLVELARRTGEIKLLDACYGLGYNTWVLANELVKQLDSPFALSVVAIEKNPEILSFLPHVLEHPTFDPLKLKTGIKEHNIYYRTEECFNHTKVKDDHGIGIVINVANNSRIEIRFLLEDLRNAVPKLSSGFDAILHDPFSPQKMPELWTADLFREYHHLLKPRQGCLLTYSAAAAVRGGLQESGFQVLKTMPLGRKSGGTLASGGEHPGNEFVAPLSKQEQDYILTRAGIPYRDPGLSQSRAEILQTRAEEQNNSSRPPGSAFKNLLQK
ncbi:MAG TPA: MnmC family methyltransferase [Coleofasciculaceae cyanobacterium]|jgi:tRNA U34 5-methylaminomethyl-2-thiouridine-forming methyltransferase MnmC